MTVDSRVLRHGAWSTVAWVVVAVAPVLFCWAAVSGLTGLLAVRLGLAIAGGPAALLVTVLLVRRALVLPHGACRGAGVLGMGVLAGGAGLVAAMVAPHGWGARTLAAGFAVSTVCYLLGMLMLPGTVPNWRARLRRVLDGFAVGVCLFFTSWLLLVVPLAGDGPGPIGPRATLALLVWLGTAVALATTVLIAARAFRYRPWALLCGAGVAAALIGQAGLVVIMLVHAPPAAAFGALAGTVAGPLLVWFGAAHTGVRTEAPHPAAETGTFAGLPLLSLPVALAAASGLYDLATSGSFGRYSAALGVLVVLAVAAREAFAVIDVRQYAADLAQQEARFRAIVSGSSDVTMVLDENLTVCWQSPAAARQLGLSDADVVGRVFSALFHPNDAPGLAETLRGILMDPPERPVLMAGRIRDGFGRWRHTESTAADHRAEPSVAGLVVHVRDVGARRQMEHTLHRMAYADPLTGLPNRRAILRGLTELRDRTGEAARRGSVIVLDIGGLKAVNDSRGHEVGDAVLVEVAHRLRDRLSPDHLVARLGGAEFAVLTSASPPVADSTAARLVTALGEPFETAGGLVFLTASAGLAEYAPGATPDELLAGADLAMRRAKQLGRNRVERYDESLEFQLLRRGVVEAELRGAERRGELDLVYQPIVRVADRQPVAVEALLRWRHPQLGAVPPEEFLRIAEETGLIGAIGRWALHQACRRLAHWLAEGRDLVMSVNLSAAQLYQPDLLAALAAALDVYEVPPDRLTVEVSECAVAEDVPRAVEQLGGMRALGVRTALDDFGTGNAALAYLRRLPLDALKVDQALVAERAAPGTPPAPLADVVVRLGERLGLVVVAEGVETEEQLAALREANCGYAQGFLFSRPVPAEHVEAFFESQPSGS